MKTDEALTSAIANKKTDKQVAEQVARIAQAMYQRTVKMEGTIRRTNTTGNKISFSPNLSFSPAESGQVLHRKTTTDKKPGLFRKGKVTRTTTEVNGPLILPDGTAFVGSSKPVMTKLEETSPHGVSEKKFEVNNPDDVGPMFGVSLGALGTRETMEGSPYRHNVLSQDQTIHDAADALWGLHNELLARDAADKEA